MRYYQRDLAFIHDRGYGLHADRCAPGLLELLSGVGDPGGGLVLELGCGSGALTRHLLAAGLRVVATDASADMLALARAWLGPDADLRLLALPGDPLPAADVIVSVGHVISYLPDVAAVETALAAMAGALRPGGVLAFDILDLGFGRARAGEPPIARVEEDWAIITTFAAPARTGWSATSPRSFPTARARGAAATSATRTCSWTRPGSRRCWPGTACRPRSGRRSGMRNSRPACVR